MIPLCTPSLSEKELHAIKEVLSSGWLADGPKNREFEKLFAKYIGVKHAISMNSCTSALFVALVASDITGEVIIPSFTFSATANTVVTAGATPIFADVNFADGNIDVTKLEALITNKTQAIMPVHYSGMSCDMDALVALCEKYDLVLIEDSAEAIGATYNGKRTGSFGIGCFSFFPTKNLTTGEGGMLTTNDDELADKINTLIAHGIPRGKKKDPAKPWTRSAHLAGYNFRLSSILAAIGVVQMSKIDKMNAARQSHASYLNRALDTHHVTIPTVPENKSHVYQMYTIRVATEIRDALVHNLNNNGIGASVHFDPPVHLQHYYRDYHPVAPTALLETERLYKSIVTLPMYPDLTQEQLDKIANAVNSFFKNHK